jgi:hypothetical protein
MEKGLITKKGKNDNYILTAYAANNPKLHSMIFGMDALRELLNGESLSLFINDIKEQKNLTKESETLLHFAIKIGVWITFIMLKAVKPSENEETNGRKKEEQTFTWIRNSILPSVILSEFMKMDIVKKGKRIKKSREDIIIKNRNHEIPPFMEKGFLSRLILNELYSPYEIDKKTSQTLEEAFNRIWPSTYIILNQLSQTQRLTEKGKTVYIQTNTSIISKEKYLQCLRQA